MSKKVLIIFMSIFLVIVSLGTISMIEFYYAKDRDKMPILSFKSENVAKQYEKYSSLFYDVYKCYSKNTFVQGKRKDEPVCPRVIKFDDNNYYTNINNFKISKKDYQMIYDVSKTLKEIESFTTKKELEDAAYVAQTYEKSLYTPLLTTIINKEIVTIVAFKEFVITNEYGDYSWAYQTADNNYKKCMKNNMYKEYENNNCIGTWKEYKMPDDWCQLAKTNTINKIIKAYNEKCK